ncbi:MAG: 30S ribosomal protein S16 [Acidimicrobiales bacterium]
MSVKLRLMRVGKKKQPTYRIVAADSRSPRDGRFIEIVGTYAPRSDPSEISVKSDKALEWLSKGAQPTETVRKLLEISGVWGQYEATRTAKPAKDRTRPSRKGPAVKAAPKKKAAVAKAETASASTGKG